jgi:large subunit ribosomal protein L10
MPLTKSQKTEVVDEIAQLLEGVSTIYLTNYSGLNVAQASDLRNRFREAGVDYKVLKNTLVRRAMERLGGFDEFVEYLNGPTAVALSEEPAAPARVIKKFLQDRNIELPELKAAYIHGSVYGRDSLDVLAALKSKDELLGDIIGLLLSPMTNVVGALQAQGQNLAAILQTLSEREE